MWYQPWADPGRQRFDPASAVLVYGRQAVPMISWEPWDPGSDGTWSKSRRTSRRIDSRPSQPASSTTTSVQFANR